MKIKFPKRGCLIAILMMVGLLVILAIVLTYMINGLQSLSAQPSSEPARQSRALPGMPEKRTSKTAEVNTAPSEKALASKLTAAREQLTAVKQEDVGSFLIDLSTKAALGLAAGILVWRVFRSARNSQSD